MALKDKFNGRKAEETAASAADSGASTEKITPAAKAQPKAQGQAKPVAKSDEQGSSARREAAKLAAQRDSSKASGFTPVHQGTSSGATAPAKAAPRGVAEAAARRSVGIRRVKMTIQKIEPLSILKIGFLLSVAMGIMIVIAMMILWFVLDAMHVFAQINDLFETLNSEQLLQIAAYLGFGRWMSFAVIIAIIDIVLFTALSAVGALVYNLVAALVGGVHITVTDE